MSRDTSTSAHAGLSNDDVLLICRAHLESLFPRTCSCCGRRFESLRDFIRNTDEAGAPVCYDAEAGDWAPEDDGGTCGVRTCQCGTSITLSSTGIGIGTMVKLLGWLRRKARRENMGYREVVAKLREDIVASVVS